MAWLIILEKSMERFPWSGSGFSIMRHFAVDLCRLEELAKCSN